MAVSLPEIEGKYEVLEKLQVGGMGAIYKVRHRLLGDVRVIKTLRPQLVDDPSFQKRFHREARAATRLIHPNVARLYDFAVDDTGAAYIVMEYIEGWPLEYLITREELTPLGLVLEISRQSLKAIAHLHANGVIHRDVSPDNLMLSRDIDGAAAVKLIDLGLAKSVSASASASEELITASGMFVGKFRYAAPEIFRRQDGSLAAPASDLYSFGLVLYELLTGRFPIQGSSAQSLIAGHLYHPPVSFDESDLGNRVADDLRQVVWRALAKSPEERFATAEDFVAALEPIRRRYDADTPATRQLLEQLCEPPRRAAAPSISLSSRSFVDRIELYVAEGDFVAARQGLTRALEAGGESDELRELGERIAETERIARTREVEVGMDEVESLRAKGKLPEALELARGLHKVLPEHKLVRLVIHELETALAVSPPPIPPKGADDDPTDADTDAFEIQALVGPPPGAEHGGSDEAGEIEEDEASILNTTPFNVTYPAATAVFDEAALAQTDILPQALDNTTRPIADGDLRAQLQTRSAGSSGWSPSGESPCWSPSGGTRSSQELTRAESQPTTPLPVEPRPVVQDEPQQAEAPPIASRPAAPPSAEGPPIERPSVEPPPVSQPPASRRAAREPSFLDLPLGKAGSPPVSPSQQEERWGYDLLSQPAAPQPPAAPRPPVSPQPQQRAFDEISLQAIPQHRPPQETPSFPPGQLGGPRPSGPAATELYLASGEADGAAVDDLTLATGEVGEVLGPPGPPSGDRPIADRSSQRLWLTAAILVVAALLIGLGLSRLTGGGSSEPLEEEDIGTAQLSTGILVVEPRPPADVVRIVDQDGRERSLPALARTPLTLELEAGSYTLSLLDPSSGRRSETTAVVIVGEETRVSRIIAP